MPADFFLIANPASGWNKAPALAERVLARLRAAGRTAELALTRGGGDARRLAGEALAAGAGAVVGCGGDGTLQELAAVLAGTAVPLGILPGGRCNDLARALGIRKSDAPETLAAHLLSGHDRAVDLGIWVPAAGGARRCFCTVATLGLDSHVTRYVAERRLPFKGTSAYLYALLRVLLRFRPPFVKLQGAFGVFEGPITLAATANTPYYGGALQIAPGARLDDGLFTLCLIEPVSTFRIACILPRVFRGGHVHDPAVRLLATPHLDIETPTGPEVVCADGEILGQTPCRLEVWPSALRIRIKPVSSA